jgi:hypothetical protein
MSRVVIVTRLLFGPVPAGDETTHLSYAALEAPEEPLEGIGGMHGPREREGFAEDERATHAPDHHHHRRHARETDHAHPHHHRPFDRAAGHHHRPHVKEPADAFLTPYDRRLTDTPHEKEPAVAHEGTSRAFKNRNPGNIKYGQFAKDFGATGKDEKGFAIFPSNAAGEKAQRALWNTSGYSDLTIGDALSQWSAGGYRGLPGFDSSKRWGDLSPDQQQNLLNAQREREGWFGDSAAAGPGRFNFMHGQFGGVGQNLTTITTKNGQHVTVNKKSAPHFLGFLNALEDAGAPIGPGSLGGYNPRQKTHGGGWSQHAFGNAIDINQRGFGLVTPAMRDWAASHKAELAAAGARFGIKSGGEFGDFGHFEWGGGGGPDQAPTRKAEK